MTETMIGTKVKPVEQTVQPGTMRAIRPSFTVVTGSRIPAYMRQLFPRITAVGIDSQGVCGYAEAVSREESNCRSSTALKDTGTVVDAQSEKFASPTHTGR